MTTAEPNPTSQPTPDLTGLTGSAAKLTPLQLNGIRLDVRHTVLTPDYLDNLVAEGTGA